MKIIHNTKTGHEYVILRTASDTKGELLEMEVTYLPNSAEPPAHFHPVQTEHFQVYSGEMKVRMSGQVQVFKAGDCFTVPPNTPHSIWNSGAQKALLNWRIIPALQSERFFETLAGLANAGKTDEKGVPGLLQIAVTMQYFKREFRLVKPSVRVQKIAFGLLSLVAGWLGYRAVY
jgi:quercetin dioxygenase-like cupin family protein